MLEQEKIYGLIGRTLGHSFSQTFFQQKFESEGINARYINFELPDIGDLMEVFAENPGLSGLNVTIPYKEQIIPYMDSMDPIAQEIGAVNVVKIERQESDPDDFRLVGFNSDFIGFSDSMRPLLTPKRDKALVLGTGGAAKAVGVAFHYLNVEVQPVSRTPGEGVITYDDLTPEIMQDHLIIVNTTPLGMYPDIDKSPNIPYSLLTPDHLCYDLLYNPDVTLFMRKAREAGAQVKNGLEMLMLQAFASWEIWNRPNQ